MSGLGGFFFASILSTLIPLVLLFLVVVFLARPGGSDRRGRRPFAVYVFAVTFISLMTVLGAFGFLGAAIGDSITDESTFGGGEVCTVKQLAPSAFPSLDENGLPFPDENAFPLPVPQSGPEICRRTGPSNAPVAIRAVLIAFIAGGVLYFHAGQARALLDKERSDG